MSSRWRPAVRVDLAHAVRLFPDTRDLPRPWRVRDALPVPPPPGSHEATSTEERSRADPRRRHGAPAAVALARGARTSSGRARRSERPRAPCDGGRAAGARTSVCVGR